MEFSNVTTLILQLLLGWAVWEMKKMRASIEDLNIKIAVVIQQVEFHDKRIEQLEKKLDYC